MSKIVCADLEALLNSLSTSFFFLAFLEVKKVYSTTVLLILFSLIIYLVYGTLFQAYENE